MRRAENSVTDRHAAGHSSTMKRAYALSGCVIVAVFGTAFVACGHSNYPVVADGVDGGTSGTPDTAPACVATEAKESNCTDGIDSDCNGQIDCLDSMCDGKACISGAGYQCTAGGCVTPGDMPALPAMTGVRLTVHGDTAIVDFDPVEGARDYRIYAYPKKEDILVGKAGELQVKNAIYRCSGDVVLQEREKDKASGYDISLGHETSTLDVSLAGYRRKVSEAVLGYVFLTPGDGRQAVYRIADPSRKGGYMNADWAVVPGNDFNAADYVLGTAARDAAVAKGGRDDGIVFYAPDAGTMPVYYEQYNSKTWAPPTVLFTDGAERDFRLKNDDPASVDVSGLRFKIFATQEAGSVPLHRVLYDRHDVLAAGEERFQRVLHQGNRPMTSLAYTGVAAQTTFVIEALDDGCPFPGGYIGGTHAPADPGESSAHPSITLDEARLAGSGEVFWNGQHDPNNRPKPIARSFVDVKPQEPPKFDFYESFGAGSTWTQPPKVGEDGSAGLMEMYQNDKWFIDIGGTTNKSFGSVLGELQIGCTDWGSSCGIGILPRGFDWKINSGSFIHTRMTVEVPSTLRRYPGIVITTTPYLAPGTEGYHPWEIPIDARLGPIDGAGGKYSTILIQPVSDDLQVQFCDQRGWGVGAQCKRANTHGPLTHWTNNGQPWLPEPVLHQLFGFDRPVQFDVYVSTDRVYLFMDDKPAGCGALPPGRMPAGPVSVFFHAVGYHLGIDDPADPDTPNKYLRSYSFLRTDRRFDELGISQGVPAPAWDEKRFPCGTEWGP